ncbi:hypothetical protein PoB_006395400 [Plakobranchus ocellatus]|uniref:Uncharacterized protein n=1 Tax=Plakobranchus ocellatus TaxID=259542 RepID=A0AAV4CZS3_9GAST|nr:hypothetical protein PoB_006395400 [Plakobranchus ocellatus]
MSGSSGALAPYTFPTMASQIASEMHNTFFSPHRKGILSLTPSSSPVSRLSSTSPLGTQTPSYPMLLYTSSSQPSFSTLTIGTWRSLVLFGSPNVAQFFPARQLKPILYFTLDVVRHLQCKKGSAHVAESSLAPSCGALSVVFAEGLEHVQL